MSAHNKDTKLLSEKYTTVAAEAISRPQDLPDEAKYYTSHDPFAYGVTWKDLINDITRTEWPDMPDETAEQLLNTLYDAAQKLVPYLGKAPGAMRPNFSSTPANKL